MAIINETILGDEIKHILVVEDDVMLQGGYIHVKSEVGKGSTFSLFLPKERQL